MLQKYVDIMKNFRKYMTVLNKNSGVNDKYFHCSSLIKNNQLFYIGINSKNKTKRSLHAEVAAIDHENIIKKRREICDIIVIRISEKNEKLSESRPCKNCIMYMYYNKKYKIKNVIYSTKDGSLKSEKLNNMIANINTAFITTNKTSK
jgi:predicted transposase YbfD/YdcC